MIRKSLSLRERKVINKVIAGRADVNAKSVQEILQRPHVAIALESILNQAGLTDNKLAKKLHEIIFRKPRGIHSQTSLDNNAINAIRMTWQAKGKFTEKHEHIVGKMADVPEEELDNIIAQAENFIK